MKTEKQIIAEELAKHGVKPVSKEESQPEPSVGAPEPLAEVRLPTPEITSVVEPKKTKVTLQLTDQEVAGLTREAKLIGITWETHLGDLVMELLDKRVAKTLINAPSFATKRITGPSKIGGHYLGS